MIDQMTAKGRIVAAAMRLAGERPWSEVSLVDVAGAAGVTLADVRREAGGKRDILAAFARMIDDEVLMRARKPAEGVGKRDSVFEVVMSRFDALSPYRAALRSISKSGALDPSLVGSFLSSQTWMLNAAGIETGGLAGAARIAGLASVYASVFHTWLEDDDPGLARTMAALDRRLRRGERTLKTMDDVMCAVGRTLKSFRAGRSEKQQGEGASPAGAAAASQPPSAPPAP